MIVVIGLAMICGGCSKCWLNGQNHLDSLLKMQMFGTTPNLSQLQESDLVDRDGTLASICVFTNYLG